MYVERWLRLIAGFLILGSVLLGPYHHSYW